MKYIASCSFGKDSLAMVLKLLELKEPLDEVVFFDTGMEFQAIYNLRDKVKPILAEANIKYVELLPPAPFEYFMFEKEVKGWKNGAHFGYGWCGATCRWGTTLKQRCISAYLASLKEPYIEYIGIAADETERIKEKNYPLVQWNMKEAECLEYCKSRGFNWLEKSANYPEGVDLYDILDRVSCWCCRNKNKKELYAMWKYLPNYWERLKEMQAKNAEPFKKYSKNGVGYGNIFELEEHFKGCKQCDTESCFVATKKAAQERRGTALAHNSRRGYLCEAI